MLALSAVLAGPRRLELTELRVPDELPVGYGLAKIEGNGLCGADYDAYMGHLRMASGAPWPAHVAGHEAVGRLVRTTQEIEANWGVSLGDRVAFGRSRCGQCWECQHHLEKYCRKYSASLKLFGGKTSPNIELNGGLAEYMLVPPHLALYRLSDELTIEDAVLFNPLGNAFEYISEVGQVMPGQCVLVLGGGQRGLACVVAAKEAGAAMVIVTGLSRDERNLALAREFGADATINVEEQDVVSSVRSISDTVDCVVDTAPRDTHTIVDAIDVVRFEGTVVLVGAKGRPIKGLHTDRIWQKSLSVVGGFSSSPRSTENAIRIIQSRRYPLEKMHTHSLSLSDVEYAIRLVGGEFPQEHRLHVTVLPNQASPEG